MRYPFRVPGWFWTDVAIPILITRLALSAIGLAALTLFPVEPSRVGWLSTGIPLLDMWSRWDGDWYTGIVERGYSYVPGSMSNIVYAPAYPALVRAVAVLTSPDHAGHVLAGVAVSAAALIVAMAYLRSIVADDLGHFAGALAVRFALVFPLSFFFSAVYPESLHLAAVLGSLSHARRGQWLAAGIFAAVAALSRPFGVLIAVALVTEIVLQRRTIVAAVAAVLPVAAFGAWMVALWMWTGRPTAYLEATAVWGRRSVAPWDALQRLADAPYGLIAASYSLVDLLLVATFVLLVIRAWRLVRASGALWASISVALLLSQNTLSSIPRYFLGLYPAYAALANAAGSRWVARGYAVVAMLASAVLMARFALWYWVG